MDNNSNSLLMEALLLALKKMAQESQDSILERLLHCAELQQVIRSIVKEEKSLTSTVARVKEYMHMDYFLKEYRISKKTFHQWKKTCTFMTDNKVDSRFTMSFSSNRLREALKIIGLTLVNYEC